MTIQGNRSEVKAESRKSGGDDVNYHIFVISSNILSIDTPRGFSTWLNHHCSDLLNWFWAFVLTGILDPVTKCLLNGRNF